MQSPTDPSLGAPGSIAFACFSRSADQQLAFVSRLDRGDSEQAPAWAGSLIEGLHPGQRQDLADLLPFLACGEESAQHVFGNQLPSNVPSDMAQSLRSIAADEGRHAELLEALRQQLPVPNALICRSRLAYFFMRLETREPAEHLARVAALDLAVCRLLQPLLRAGAVLNAAPALHAALVSLRQDEARHVRVARALARKLGTGPDRQAVLDRRLAERLDGLLAPVRPALMRLSVVADASLETAGV